MIQYLKNFPLKGIETVFTNPVKMHMIFPYNPILDIIQFLLDGLNRKKISVWHESGYPKNWHIKNFFLIDENNCGME